MHKQAKPTRPGNPLFAVPKEKTIKPRVDWQSGPKGRKAGNTRMAKRMLTESQAKGLGLVRLKDPAKRDMPASILAVQEQYLPYSAAFYAHTRVLKPNRDKVEFYRSKDGRYFLGIRQVINEQGELSATRTFLEVKNRNIARTIQKTLDQK